MVEKGDLKIARSTKRGSNLKRGESYKREKQKRPSLINIWGIAGRQEIMEMRRLWQLRITGFRV